METKDIILELRTKKGMPLEDSNISKEKDGFFNEEYCKWCYADGEYTYDNMDDLIDFCADHMANEHFSPEQVRAYMRDMLPKLDYWKQYKYHGGAEKFEEFKRQLINEFNELHISEISLNVNSVELVSYKKR